MTLRFYTLKKIKWYLSFFNSKAGEGNNNNNKKFMIIQAKEQRKEIEHFPMSVSQYFTVLIF